MREVAKPCAHSSNYGVGIDKLARLARTSLDNANTFAAAMQDRLPQMCTWRDWIRDRAKSGEVLDNGFGRALHVDPNRSWTQGPALMGQGTARDLMMQWRINIDDYDTV